MKNLLRAIQNFHHQEILDLDRETNLKQGVGRHTNAGLLFTQEEIAQLTKTFVDLYKSRQDKIAEDKY